MFRRGLVAMTGRLLLCVAFVANILVLVACTETIQGTGVSPASATSSSSYASSSSSAKTVVKSKPKCRRTRGVRKCPKNEEFSFCPESVHRAQYCSEKAEPSTYKLTSSKPCEEGCVCKENYLRAENGTCVPAEQCPVTCGVNEILSNCPIDCPSDYCPTEEDKEAKPCVMPDVCPPPVCKCTFNHRRASNGSCIPTIECPPYTCGTNEEYNPCPPICPTDDCSQASPSGECPPQFGHIGILLPCDPKCRCIEGYWRLDGICVPYGQCPGVCPANERYSTCTQAECRALNCTQKGQSVPCIRMNPQFCKKGCVCEEGYLRNEDGICVLEDKCEPAAPSCTSANEEFVPCMQGVCRAKDCSQKGEDVPCPDIPQEQCDSGCICKEHFLRSANGSCVPEDQCEPLLCPINEEWSTCAQATCRAQYCSQKGGAIFCPRIAEGYCEEACVCKENYLRNENGDCVPEDQCPGICPANERFSTCTQAECRALNCTQKGQSVPCIRLDPQFCIKGCVCEEGYLRNEDGICVLEDKCEPPKTCGNNEVLDNCSLSCNSDNCPQSADEEQVCTQSDPCVPACKCKFNYRRSENGTCIPTRDCPPFDCSAKPNEEFVACPPFCPTDECGKPRLEGRCPFKIGTFLQCNPKCQCKDGYGRVNGTCVPFEKCPGLCPTNEVYSSCVQQTCRQQNCSDRDVAVKTCPSRDEASCQRGCVCQENYYRNDEGVCVPYEKCEGPKTCGENEVLDNCPMTCNSDNCPQSADEKQVCTQADPCIPACKCRFNYKRAENGTCIPARNCPPKTCGENEVLDNCSLSCNSDNCPKSADEEQLCTQSDPCVPACKCKFNYRRSENGTCIPTRDCSPFDCSAKPNEEFVACPPLCPTDECGKPRLEGRCPFKIGTFLQCNPKCQCKDGYGRVNGTCVPFEKCPGLCPTNEVYSSCVQQTCRQQNCSDRDVAMKTCPSRDEASCQRGCVCQENYYRNDKGVCVPHEECEAPKPCGENEVLDNCPMTCNSDNCPQSADEKQVCTQADPCIPACKCRFNYKRAENGTCIPTRDCPPFDCSAKPNEEFVACPPLCPTDECGTPRLEGRCPFRIGIILNCNPKCQCKDGYGRVNGTCVPFEKCPGLCPTNEVYSSCVQQTCRQQKCLDRDLVMETCPSVYKASCQRGCVCQENYYRNGKGACVSYEECGGPMCPNAHEEYKPDFKKCPPNTCNSLVARYACDENQKEGPGCMCESGYLRINVTSTCIPICDCPEMKYSPDC